MSIRQTLYVSFLMVALILSLSGASYIQGYNDGYSHGNTTNSCQLDREVK